MPFWQRFLVLLVAMLAISLLIGLIWRLVFSFALPEYVTGIIAGLTAVPLWDFLKRIKPEETA